MAKFLLLSNSAGFSVLVDMERVLCTIPVFEGTKVNTRLVNSWLPAPHGVNANNKAVGVDVTESPEEILRMFTSKFGVNS